MCFINTKGVVCLTKKIRTYRVGEESVNNFGSRIVISEYIKATDITIFFPEYNWSVKATYGQFQNGLIKCPYERRTYGVGYIGEGQYQPKENGKTTKAYEKWNDMLQRCYNEKMIQRNKTYSECEVCDEWHCFQNFAQWFNDNYYTVESQSTHLDKDILNKNNKIYSPDTCVFVPKEINNLFVKQQRQRGDTPIGVHKLKYDKYRATISIDSKNKILGEFDTMEEAFYAYKLAKEQNIKDVADKYKELIPDRLYNAMYSYEIELDD